MPRGRGRTKKKFIEIREKCLEPYYIKQEENQFVLLKAGSIIPEGYFRKLSEAVNKVIPLLMLSKNAEKVCTFREYLDIYENLQKEVMEVIAA